MADPVRITLLGNSFAARVQLPALRWAQGSRVVAIAGHDIDKARATARAWGIPHAEGDWRAALEHPSDLVLVTTPVDLHRPMAAAALESGRAVLCEKPFALDAAQARELARRAAGRPAWVDHELRWSPHLRELRRRLRAGEAGELRHVAVEMLLPPQRHAERPWSWWFDARRGGGVLGAIGSHLVDLLRWCAGEIAEVRASLATYEAERPDARGVRRPVTADEHATLALRFRCGARGSLETSIALPSERFFRLQVVGSEQTLRLVGGDELWAGPTTGALAPVPVVPPLPSCEELGMPEYGLFGRCLPFFLRDVVAAVRDGRSAIEDAATFQDGLATQEVLDAARRSAASRGGWVAC